VDILLVEDNPDHAEFTLSVLVESDAKSRTYWVKDGEEALDFLHHRRRWVDAPRPDLILLDINLPKVDGKQVLQRLKGDATFRSIPIVMLTTSDRPHEIIESYRAGANSFVIKPGTFKHFGDQIAALKFYWTLTNHPPVA
jgi:two-component system response regulator